MSNGRNFAYAGLVAILLGTLAYCVVTTGTRHNVLAAADPMASASTMDDTVAAQAFLGDNAASAYARFMNSAAEFTAGQRETLDYAVAHAGSTPIQLAVEGGSYGSDPCLLTTDARVATLGGYLGFDPAPTASQLVDWVHAGRVRFVLLPAVFLQLGGGQSKSPAASSEATLTNRVGWFTCRCAVRLPVKRCRRKTPPPPLGLSALGRSTPAPRQWRDRPW